MRKKTRKGNIAAKSIRRAEDEEVIKLAELILAEAKKMAKLQVRMAAEEVLLEATAIARWTKRPFYVA
jgi:hypothetical protein